MEKEELYSWKVSFSVDFNRPGASSTSVSIKFKNKKKPSSVSLSNMPKPKKSKRTASKSNKGLLQMVVTPTTTRRMPTRNLRKSFGSTPSPTTDTKRKSKRTRRALREEKAERKPTAFLNIDDISTETCETVQRTTRPLQDNKVYIIPDSDEDDDVIVEEVQADPNLTEEKHKWIQNYINSITPNRIDYTNKSPMADIIQIKDDEWVKSPEATEQEIQRIMQKYANSISPKTNVLERVDYMDDGVEIRRPAAVATSSTEGVQTAAEPVPSTSWAFNMENNASTSGTETANNSSTPINKYSAKSTFILNRRKCRSCLTDSAIMDFVEQVVVEQLEEISKEVEECHDRMWGLQDEQKKMRIEAEKNNCMEIDSSMEIIKTPDFLDTSVQLVDVKEENITKQPKSSENVKKQEDKNESSNFKKVCPICLDPLSDAKEISATVCGHVFCTACIKTAIRTHHRCPNCRTKLSLKKIIPLFL